MVYESYYKQNNDLHGDIIPSANNTYALGNSDYKYRRAYINNLYTDYMYPNANSATIGTESNPYLCMFMTTTNAYTDYAVVNKAYLNTRIVIENKTVYVDAQGYSNFGTKTNGVLVSAYPTSGTKYYGLIGENGSGTFYGYLFDWGNKVTSMTAGNITVRMTWLVSS